MGHIITDLKETFRRGNTFIRLIYINVGIFVIGTLISVILQLFNLSATGIFDLFALPASLHRFILQPWSLLSYMFMHAGFLHILFNMLWLYWFGSLFLYFFSGKHLRGLYVLGGICGGLFYMIAYNIFPYFSQTLPFSTLVGASASVLAIVAATAYREPNYRVQLFLFRRRPFEISRTNRYRNGPALYYIQQCRRTHRPLRRRTCRALVCSQSEQRQRRDLLDQLVP